MRKTLLLGLLLVTPLAAMGAGFAKQSIFLSRSSVTEGQSVHILAVVSSESAFTGTLTLSDGDATIGSATLKLAAGEAQVASVPWTPTAGPHTITATLKNATGTVEVQSATFTIAPKPKPIATSTPTASATVESSSDIQKGIANLSPTAADATAPFFSLIDSGRAKAAEAIDSQLAATKAHLGGGSVLGADTAKEAASDPMGAFWRVLETLYLYLLTILRFIVGSAAIFYPVFAAVFLYVLWKIFKRFRRPAY